MLHSIRRTLHVIRSDCVWGHVFRVRLLNSQVGEGIGTNKPEWLASRLKTGRSYVISSGRAQFPWSTLASPTCGAQQYGAHVQKGIRRALQARCLSESRPHAGQLMLRWYREGVR